MSKTKFIRGLMQHIDEKNIEKHQYHISDNDYNSRRFLLAFLGRSALKYYSLVLIIFGVVIFIFVISASLVGTNLLDLLFTNFARFIEYFCYIIPLLVALIFSRRLFLQAIEARDTFLGEVEGNKKGEFLKPNIDIEAIGKWYGKYTDDKFKIDNKKETIIGEYRENIDRWIRRMFGRKWILIFLAIAIFWFVVNPLAIVFGQFNFHSYIGRLISGTWVDSAVLDLTTKLPLFIGLGILIINCLGVALIIYIMSKWKVKTSMLHPDGSGGLRPLGELALKNVFAWALTMTTLIIAITSLYVYNPPTFGFGLPLLVVYSILICISTVLIFVIPLRSVHSECIANKVDKLTEVQTPFDKSYAQFQEELKKGEKRLDPNLIEELILLNTLNEQIEEMRDWPWDTGILWKAFLAILLPIIVEAIIQIGNLLF